MGDTMEETTVVITEAIMEGSPVTMEATMVATMVAAMEARMAATTTVEDLVSEGLENPATTTEADQTAATANHQLMVAVALITIMEATTMESKLLFVSLLFCMK